MVEIDQKNQKKNIISAKMKKGAAITGAGNLKCKHIIHVDAPDNPEDWKNRITNSLRLAENNHITPISFPALGTG